MATITVPWGKHENLSIELPASWMVKAELKPRRPEERPTLAEALDRALAKPIGSPRLSEFAKRGKSAAVVVDDRTRPTPVAGIMPKVLAELNAAGVEDKNITVVMGLGTHRPMTEPEIKERVGPAVLARVRCENHDYQDPAKLKEVGRTPTHGIPVTFNQRVVEADTVVVVGTIEAHEQAGFGGGYKGLMPGVAGEAPITFTHNYDFQKVNLIASAGLPREKCRFRQAVDEAGQLLGPKVFIVNTILDPVEVIEVVAGDPISAWNYGSERVRAMNQVEIPGLADIVIADSHPLDTDLRVAMKSCFYSAMALKPGGVFIGILRAEEGLGDLRVPEGLPPFAKLLIKVLPLSLLRKVSDRLPISPDQRAGSFSFTRMMKSFHVLFYVTSMPAVAGFQNLGVEFFQDIPALIARARALQPGPAEVLVFPQGGATFVKVDSR